MCLNEQVKIQAESIEAFKVFAITPSQFDYGKPRKLLSWFSGSIVLKHYYKLNQLITNDMRELVDTHSNFGFYAFENENDAIKVVNLDKYKTGKYTECSIWAQAFPYGTSIILPVTLSGDIFKGVLKNTSDSTIAYPSYRASHITVNASEEIIEQYNLQT